MNSNLEFVLPKNFNTGILVLEGSIKINEKEVALTDSFCLFKNDGTDIKIEAIETSKFLVLSGEPINEPIVAYGPFLMNTYDQIQQAIKDFGTGKFGHLE